MTGPRWVGWRPGWGSGLMGFPAWSWSSSKAFLSKPGRAPEASHDLDAAAAFPPDVSPRPRGHDRIAHAGRHDAGRGVPREPAAEAPGAPGFHLRAQRRHNGRMEAQASGPRL